MCKILVKCSYKYAIYAKAPPFWVIFEVKNMEFPTGIMLILGSKICKFPTYLWWSFPGPSLLKTYDLLQTCSERARAHVHMSTSVISLMWTEVVSRDIEVEYMAHPSVRSTPNSDTRAGVTLRRL
jgi:hypothetical protein